MYNMSMYIHVLYASGSQVFPFAGTVGFLLRRWTRWACPCRRLWKKGGEALANGQIHRKIIGQSMVYGFL